MAEDNPKDSVAAPIAPEPADHHQTLDWVAAPGDVYQKHYCPPPPHCSPSLYVATTWVRTTGDIKVGELERIPDYEVLLIRRWLHQLIFTAMPAPLTQAEQELLGATPPGLTDAQIQEVLMGADLRVLKRAFELRAEGACGCSQPAAPSS